MMCVIFSGFIAAMVYVFAITGGDFKLLVVVQCAFLLWVIFSVALNRERIEYSIYSVLVLLILALVLISNLFINMNNYDTADRGLLFAMAHVGGVLFFAFSAQWAVSNLQPTCILEFISWMLMPLIVLALSMGLLDAENSRSTPFGVHPNWWGEVAFGFILCALVINKILVKAFFIAAGIGLMIVVQSRGALLGAAVSLLAYFFMQHRPWVVISKKKLALFGVIILCVLAFGMVTGFWLHLFGFVESKILLLNDPYRGVNSGLTGRIAGWWSAIEIFIENPVFGQGFDTLVDVHNGFLRWAGEGGALLLIVMLLLIMSALVRSWCKHNDWVFAVLLGVLVYLMTYPRALNMNLVGMLFLFSLFPWRKVCTQRSKENTYSMLYRI